MGIDIANGFPEQNFYIEKANVPLKYSKTIVFQKTFAVNDRMSQKLKLK